MSYTRCVDALIVGGGSAGLAAAIQLHKEGFPNILILERDVKLGGILNQCIHNGFGLHWFKEELTGPEYAGRFIAEAQELGVPYLLDTMVLELRTESDGTKTAVAISPTEGYMEINAKAVVLAMGCRERTAGSIMLPGERPAGVYTAGMAQRLLNLEGYMPGKTVVILGSGDIGLIMARRLTWEGAEVKAVCELMPWSSGLARNIQQCLVDNDIPLMLSHTVVKVHGRERVEAVTVAAVDEKLRPIPGTEQTFECDTLLLSVGLTPENELSIGAGVELSRVTNGAVVNEFRETNIPGVFACGNVLQVHDLVDYVSEEAVTAAKGAAEYLRRGALPVAKLTTEPGFGIRYVLPQRLTADGGAELYFRPSAVYRDGKLQVRSGERIYKQARRLKIAPGEMERLSLSAEEVASAQGSIVVEWVPDEK